MSELDDLLSFDPLNEAEKLTSQSYKEDKLTESLGVLMHLDHVQNKRKQLALRNDTYYSGKFRYTLDIFRDLGFEIVHRTEFLGTYKNDEIFLVLWHPDGILATVESYGSVDGSTNNAKIYYNWNLTDTDANLWDFISSGVMTDNTIVGNHDVREGLRHVITKFQNHGEFLSTWIKRPYLSFMPYAEWNKITDADWDTRRAHIDSYEQNIIDSLPEYVRSAITPKEEI